MNGRNVSLDAYLQLHPFDALFTAGVERMWPYGYPDTTVPVYHPEDYHAPDIFGGERVPALIECGFKGGADEVRAVAARYAWKPDFIQRM